MPIRLNRLIAVDSRSTFFTTIINIPQGMGASGIEAFLTYSAVVLLSQSQSFLNDIG